MTGSYWTFAATAHTLAGRSTDRGEVKANNTLGGQAVVDSCLFFCIFTSQSFTFCPSTALFPQYNQFWSLFVHSSVSRLSLCARISLWFFLGLLLTA